MRRSLQRHLSLVLGSIILLAGLVAAAASFGLAYLEAQELQDDMLRQIAILSTSSGINTAAYATHKSDLNDDGISDPESLVTIYRLPSDTAPVWLNGDLSPGMHTISTATEQLRVFVRDRHIVVSQHTEVRDEIAINSAMRTLIPILFLLPVLAWLIVRIVRNELAPITQLSKSLDEQPTDRPQPISDDALPEEITPFVHAINRLLTRVNTLMGQQRRFIADAAHELRSPLTALSVQMQNLIHADSLNVMRERAVPLSEGIERLRKLTEQLLNLAMTQAGTNRDQEVNVSVMARELMAEFLPLAEARNIDLGLDEIGPLTMRATPDALRLILKNALENSLKYTPNSGEVTLRLLSDDDSSVIEIVDNGPGIPVAERERVFDSFYRMSGTIGEGSGLGLAIAREAASRLGGVISLDEPIEGRGLVFRYRQKIKK